MRKINRKYNESTERLHVQVWIKDKMEESYTLYTMKKKIIVGLIAAIVITLVMIFSGCIEDEEKVPYEEQSPQIVKRTEEYSYISFEELYRDTPTNLTDQKAWEQWKSKYKGKYVKETGRLDVIYGYGFPEKGKLFLIITIPSEESHVENNETQVLFCVEGASTIRLGEKEGTFLINGVKWICLGDTYTFSGKVSNFSSFDMDLVYGGYDGLIIIEGKIIELSKE